MSGRTYANPGRDGVDGLRDIVKMPTHVERDRHAGGAREHTDERDRLRYNFFRDARD